MLDPYTRPYALAFLISRGGTVVDGTTGALQPVNLPDYVGTPWRELPRWRRFRIVAAFHASLWFGRGRR